MNEWYIGKYDTPNKKLNTEAKQEDTLMIHFHSHIYWPNFPYMDEDTFKLSDIKLCKGFCFIKVS